MVTAVHTVDGKTVPGSYRLTCETTGMAGNDYVGPLHSKCGGHSGGGYPHIDPGRCPGPGGTAHTAGLSEYLLERRQLFGAASDVNTYAVNIYRARISAAMMEVDGVENVTQVRLNGVDDDLILTQNALLQQLPVEGTVTLHAL